MKDVRVEIQVSGRVQGVAFRHFTTLRAQELELKGWVANLADGTVKVVAQGTKDKLETFLQQLRKGPSRSRVEGVETCWMDSTAKEEAFRIRFIPF